MISQTLLNIEVFLLEIAEVEFLVNNNLLVVILRDLLYDLVRERDLVTFNKVYYFGKESLGIGLVQSVKH